MVAAATVPEPRLVADFAAGGGALLEAAAARWPLAAVLAADIDADAVAQLRERHSSWRSERLDFSDPTARGALSSAGVGAGGCVVLLNPPFSERGAAPRWPVSMGGVDYRCGRALAFACWAAEALVEGSEMICLLPAGAVHSERDAPAMAALARLGEAEVTPCQGDSLFAGYRLRTAILRLRKRAAPSLPAIDVQGPPSADLALRLVRGQARGWTEASPRFRGPAFVHTTDMREGKVITRRRLSVGHARASQAIRGPAVLMPRVGRPDVRKVCVWTDPGGGAVISDCVIAIRAASLAEAEELGGKLRRGWSLIEGCYGGTCAPYITLRRLAAVLVTLDIEIRSPTASPPAMTALAVD